MKSENTLTRLTPEATIDQIISADQHAAELLASIGMSPEQHESQTLRSVCQQRHWNEEELLKWIKKNHKDKDCVNIENEDPDFEGDVSKWCNYIEGVVHPCITNLLNEIERDFPRVQLIHGNQYPRLKNMDWLFHEFKEDLKRYISFEQQTLIPLASELHNRKESILYGKVKDLKRSVQILESDRAEITNIMDTIDEHSHQFKNPEGACTTMRIMNKNFINLFDRLEKYFRLENDRLFPLIKDQIESL
jgi:iron-sulfur cluster repair protein YtfE (RIC family)